MKGREAVPLGASGGEGRGCCGLLEACGPQALACLMALAHSILCAWNTLGMTSSKAAVNLSYTVFPSPSLLHVHRTHPPLADASPISFTYIVQMQAHAGTDFCLLGSLIFLAPRAGLGPEELIFISICWRNDQNVEPLMMGATKVRGGVRGSVISKKRSEEFSVLVHGSEGKQKGQMAQALLTIQHLEAEQTYGRQCQLSTARSSMNSVLGSPVQQAQHKLPLLQEALLDSRHLPRDTNSYCLITIVSPNRLQVRADVRVCGVHLWGSRRPAGSWHTSWHMPNKLPTETHPHAWSGILT